MDHRAIILISGILLLLVAASATERILRRYLDYGIDASIINTCRARIQAWWILFGLLTCTLILGTMATVFLFFIISFWALREYITLTPTRPADHRTLFWVFFLWTPLQFLLVGIDDEWFRQMFGIGSYQVYSVLIPTYAFLILPAAIAASDDSKRFLERIAKIQVGLVICVYSLSFAPALLTTTLPISREAPPVISEVFAGGLEGKVLPPIEDAISGAAASPTQKSGAKKAEPIAEKSAEKSEEMSAVVTPTAPDENAEVTTRDAVTMRDADTPEKKSDISPEKKGKKSPRKVMTTDHLCLLVFFVFVVQMSDIFQYLWSQFFKSGVIAPTINSNKTWPGVLAGAMSSALLAMGLWYFTPFPEWWQPLISGFVISLMGFAGSMTMSAIKRDRGVEDYGTLIEGHNGVLDRIDSLCFAAPVFFHLVWLFLNLELRPFS